MRTRTPLVCLLILTLASVCWGNDKPQCKKPTPKPPVTTPSDPTSIGVTSTSGASASSSSSSTSSANQQQGQQQGQGQQQTATGGNATGGNASSSATGGQGGAGGQGGDSSSGASASNGGNTVSNSETYQQVRQAPPAFAPTILPANCQGSLTGAASSPFGGVALGGSKADKNCQALAVAAAFAQMRAFKAAAKVLCNMRASKEAKLTLDDCMAMEAQLETANRPEPAPQPIVVHDQVPPTVILLQEPVTVEPTRAEMREAGLLKPAKPAVKHVVKRKPCVIPESLRHDTLEK